MHIINNYTYTREPVRVCSRCCGMVIERRNSRVAELINTDDDDASIAKSINQSDSMISDQRSERTYSANIKDMISGSDDIEKSHEEEVVTNDNMPPSRQSQYSIQREDGQDFRLTVASSSSEEDFVVITMGHADGRPNQFPVGLDSPAQHSTLDVDALRSKLSQLEAVDDPMASPTGSLPGSVHTNEPFYESENVQLEGGGAHKVVLRIDTAGVVIIWEFSTEPKVCII